jgi:hypothetical protein
MVLYCFRKRGRNCILIADVALYTIEVGIAIG